MLHKKGEREPLTQRVPTVAPYGSSAALYPRARMEFLLGGVMFFGKDAPKEEPHSSAIHNGNPTYPYTTI